MSEQENFNLDEVISGEKKIEYVDKLELLREKVNSKSVLSSRSNKKELIEIVENLIDLMPVELRTARWLVREQDTYLNKAREEANEILSIAKIESDRLIADSYVLQEAVIEANALIKKAEDEAQAYRAQIEDQRNKDFVVQTSVSVASVKGTDFWMISDKSKGDSIIGIEGVIQLANKISGEIIDITSGITGLSSNNGQLESYNTDPKTIPSDPSGDDSDSQTIRIEFMDASGKKKTLVIEYQ